MKALVVGGGGPKGAWSAGVMQALAEAGLLDDVAVAWGNSVGAINSAYFSVHGPEALRCGSLSQFWLATDDEQVSTAHTGGILSAFWKSGLRDPAPLRRLLKAQLAEPRESRFCWHRAIATNLIAGSLEYGSSDLPFDMWVEWIVASCAHPGWVDSIEISGNWYTDGGVIDVVPVRYAVEVDGPKEIFAIAHSPDGPPSRWDLHGKPGFFSRLWREAEVAMHHRTQDDLIVPDHVTLHVIRPEKPLEADMPHFNPDVSSRLLDEGYAVGHKWAEGHFMRIGGV